MNKRAEGSGRTAHRTHCDGFTLIELIMVIVLLGILAAVGSNMLSDSFTTTRMVNDAYARQSEARYVQERLAREAREVKYLSSGSYCITTMTASSLVYQKPDAGSTDQSNCNTASSTVTISYSAPNLTIAYSSPAATGTLTNAVATNGFSFSYYQNDGVTVVDQTSGTISDWAKKVKIIHIRLAVPDPASTSNFEQIVRVSLRNSS
jgi:prepilin-type N-terminal cleavage/methylation domain-containing protein